MKTRIALVAALLLNFYSSGAQTLPINEPLKTYEIEVGARKLGKLTLIERNKSEYSGYVSYVFFEGKPTSAKSFVGRLFNNSNAKKVSDSVLIKNKLPDSLAGVLMLGLQNTGIEDLIPCNEDNDCAKINFLDPNFTVFNLKIDGKAKQFEYASIGYPSAQFPEKTQLRRRVQDLVNICVTKIDYSKEFKTAREKLKKGSYFIATDQGYLTFKR